jgi:hypothetical protein
VSLYHNSSGIKKFFKKKRKKKKKVKEERKKKKRRKRTFTKLLQWPQCPRPLPKTSAYYEVSCVITERRFTIIGFIYLFLKRK